MGKGIFGSLFGGKDEEEVKTPEVSKSDEIETPKVEEIKEVDFSVPVPVYKAGDESNHFLADFNKMYDEGFKSLNREGVDFFEFYDSVNSTGIDDVKSYEMTMKILLNVDKNLTKEFIVDNGKFYLESIHDKYLDFKKKGEEKQENLKKAKEIEKTELYDEIQGLEREYNRVRTALDTKKDLYRTLDSRYQTQLNEVDGRLKANDMARNEIIAKIRKVIMNIKQYLK